MLTFETIGGRTYDSANNQCNDCERVEDNHDEALKTAEENGGETDNHNEGAPLVVKRVRVSEITIVCWKDQAMV